jgi:hypothetical protein
MEELDAYRHGLLSALESVIPELSRIAASIPADAWRIPKKPGAHTPHYTLAHMYELEAQVFSPLLRSIVDNDARLLPSFDDSSWMSSHYEPGKPAQMILEEYTHLLGQEVRWLRSLSPKSWSRTARHPWWGVHTLQWWVEQQLESSRQHLSEITAFLAV